MTTVVAAIVKEAPSTFYLFFSFAQSYLNHIDYPLRRLNGFSEKSRNTIDGNPDGQIPIQRPRPETID
jgi:hypothetical protein